LRIELKKTSKNKEICRKYRKGERGFGNKGKKERNAKELLKFPMDKHMKEEGEVRKKYKDNSYG
jgi:hypothetical protein